MKVQPFLKTGRRFVYKQYYRSKSKSKVVLRVNYGDSRTVVLSFYDVITGTLF